MPRYHVFRTALGWMGVAGRSGLLTRVFLPAHGRAEVERRIRAACPGATAGRDYLLLEAARQLSAYADGNRIPFDLPLDLAGEGDRNGVRPPEVKGSDPFSAPFRQRVVRACMAISFGRCRTYGQVAAAAGSPGAARAVGQVMRANPLPIVVPCHRVIGADGRMVGFSAPGGLWLKERLLLHEGIPLRGGKVVL